MSYLTQTHTHTHNAELCLWESEGSSVNSSHACLLAACEFMIQLTLEDMPSTLTLHPQRLPACEWNTQICGEKHSLHTCYELSVEKMQSNYWKRLDPGEMLYRSITGWCWTKNRWRICSWHVHVSLNLGKHVTNRAVIICQGGTSPPAFKYA